MTANYGRAMVIGRSRLTASDPEQRSPDLHPGVGTGHAADCSTFQIDRMTGQLKTGWARKLNRTM